MTERRHLPQLESIQRISRIPVVETGVHLATGLYGKVKNSNPLTRWYLNTIESGINLAIDTTLIAGPLLEVPLSVVDSIVCKGLDTVQQKVPAINYPPEKIINQTKSYVSNTIVQPVLKRAESVKEFSVYEATKLGELAASRIDTALDVADQYVEKYLPDSSDTTDGKVLERNGESKAIHTIEHVNRLSRKLQRRLTKRTIAEAKALRRQGFDALQVLLKLAELMVRDPIQFAGQIKEIWATLSQDEPENQVPPANLEQLIALITRESARRVVHFTNFSVKIAAQLPSLTMHAIQFSVHQMNILLDRVLKGIHLEGVKAAAVRRAESEIHKLNVTVRDVQVLLEHLLSSLLSSRKHNARAQDRLIPPHTLSPVAQSPERTPESQTKEEKNTSQRSKEQQHQNVRPQQQREQEQRQPQQQLQEVEKQQNQQQRSGSPKKSRKSKSNNHQNSSPSIIETPPKQAEDVNSNRKAANGDIPSN